LLDCFYTSLHDWKGFPMAYDFIDTLRSWQNFYFMAGGVAATLIGLMFVALSLGMHLISADTKAEMKVFVTPSVVYFVSALIVACVMLVPSMTPAVLGIIMMLGGVLGLARALVYAAGLIGVAKRHQDFVLEDWLAQVVAPVVSYILLLFAGIGFVSAQYELGFHGLWLGVLLLVITAITNIWGLIIWIIDQHQT
jgi:hypothetical protein